MGNPLHTFDTVMKGKERKGRVFI